MGYLEDWSFKGDGFVELDRNLLPHYNPDEEEIIHIEFSTTQPNGLLFWHGQTPETYGKGQDYWSVAGTVAYQLILVLLSTTLKFLNKNKYCTLILILIITIL